MSLTLSEKKPLSLGLLWLFQYLHFHFIFQQQRLLHLLSLVLLWVILIPMGVLGLIGDNLFLNGLLTRNLDKIIQARDVFPFERDILVGPAQFYSREKLVDTKTLYYFRDALTYDPYSVQFLSVYGQLQILNKNGNEVLIVKNRLEKIAPNSNGLKRINDLTKGLK